MITIGTTTSALGKLELFFKSLGEDFQSVLVKLFGSPAVNALEAQIKQIFSADVVVIIKDGVAFAETLAPGSSSEQKRMAAFTQITSDLKSKGLSLAEQTINLGIELVVGLAKAKA